MADLIEIDPADGGGEARVLATLVPTNATPLVLDTVFPDALLVPKSKWKPISFKQYFPRIKDQNGIGMCGCSAGGNVTEGTRRMVGGLADVDLSAGDVYRRVSGGRDRGSLPEDVLQEIVENGIAPTSDVPYLEWQRNVNSPTRKNYKIDLAYWCPTTDHVGSALQQGFLIHGSSWWYKRDPIDSDGWLQPEGGGGRGGHSYGLCGMQQRGNRWGYEFPNSWTFQWGLGGFGVAPEERIAEGCRVFQLWACRSTLQESGNIPAPSNN